MAVKRKWVILLPCALALVVVATLLVVYFIPRSRPAIAADLPAGAKTEDAGQEAPFVDADGNIVFYNGRPSELLLLPDGTVLVTDTYNNAIWRVPPQAEGELWVGRLTLRDLADVPVGGYNDAAYLQSAFLSPWAITSFYGGYAVSDPDNNVIRYIGDDKVRTAVGDGTPGYRDGFSVETQFNNPTGLATDDKGNLYIADTGNHVIRMLNTQGDVITFAGSVEGRADGALREAAFCAPTGLCWANGALYVADSGNHRICKIENGQVSTLAGAPPEDDTEAEQGNLLDGPTLEARFSNPQGVLAAADGSVYVADTGNSAVRVIRGGQVETVMQLDSPADATWPASPRGLLLVDDILYVADNYAGIVYRHEL